MYVFLKTIAMLSYGCVDAMCVLCYMRYKFLEVIECRIYFHSIFYRHIFRKDVWYIAGTYEATNNFDFVKSCSELIRSCFISYFYFTYTHTHTHTLTKHMYDIIFHYFLTFKNKFFFKYYHRDRIQ